MIRFNINADMAEGYGPWQMGDDDGLLQIIGSANIACGFHGGDYAIMGKVMQQADAAGVSIGAHPGFYDLHGFGRRQLQLSDTETERLVAYQLGAALGIAALNGLRVSHVKPHGALNNMACADQAMAAAIVRAIKAVDDSQILLAPVLSALLEAGENAGLPVAAEVFADRAYMPDGQLVPRNRPDAMIHEPDLSLAHCIRMLEDGVIRCIDNSELKIQADSICVHGDEPGAVATASVLKQGLIDRGMEMVPLPQLVQ